MSNSESPASKVDSQVAHQLVGKVLAGRYEIASLLGIGSMAAVYLVHHVAIRKRMAVKVLHPSLLQIPEMLARFEREALVAGHLEHVNVAAAHDFGRTDDGGLFLVLEYIEGRELRASLQEGPMSVARTLNIARQIASVLERSHALQIIHREPKLRWENRAQRSLTRFYHRCRQGTDRSLPPLHPPVVPLPIESAARREVRRTNRRRYRVCRNSTTAF